VNLGDLAAFCAQWPQQEPPELQADLNGDGKVDFADFNYLAGYWSDTCPVTWPF
jgi:hypothetical protein